MSQIEVLGTGCPTCHKFYEIVEDVLHNINPELQVTYVNDIQKIIDIGLMQSPVLVIDGKAVITGFNSDKEFIKKIILDNL